MNDCGFIKFKYTGEKRIKDALHLAAAVTRKHMFYLLLLLFEAKFCEFWTKEEQKLRADVKHV